MNLTDIILLFFAGIISGSLNAIVGGGSFVSFPALIFCGINPIMANATSTVALWPGTLASLWAQRNELPLHKHLLKYVITASVIGGAIGAIILIKMSDEGFASIVPYLLLVATLLFTFRASIIKLIKKIPHNINGRTFLYYFIFFAIQLIISVYGGFFGAGMGILFLAFYAVIGIDNIHEANALRNCGGAAINSIATLIFIISGNVAWLSVTALCMGAITGGYFCAHFAKKVESYTIRKIVVAIAWFMTFCFFLRF